MNCAFRLNRLFTVNCSRFTLLPFFFRHSLFAFRHSPLALRLSLFAFHLVVFASQAAAQSSADLADSLRKHAAHDHAIPWSAAQRLEWQDFRGRPGSTSSTAAETASGIGYMLQCRDGELSFAVLATFSKEESWVRTDVPGSATASAGTLRHERTHFDISELFARRLRQALSSAHDICPHHTKDARRTFEQLRSASEAMQKGYDRDTAHGTASAPQAAWEKRVRAGLDSLSRYGVNSEQ